MADAAELEKWRELAINESEHAIRNEIDNASAPTMAAAYRSLAASWRSLASFLEQMEGLAGREWIGVASEEIASAVWDALVAIAYDETPPQDAAEMVAAIIAEHAPAPVEVAEERSKT